MNLREWETKLVADFQRAGFEQPSFEARRLLQGALAFDDLAYMNKREDPIADQARIEEWSRRRLSGEPLAYLEGKKGFYKSEFLVERGVLVPRPETEHVVEVALERKPDARTIVDFGCGSGCIGLSLALEMPNARLVCVDTSSIACRVTSDNARRLGVGDRIRVCNQSVCDWQSEGEADLVVANPPYIAPDDPQVQESVHDFEPHEALYSGPSGTEAFEAWSKHAHEKLARGGIFVGEFGSGQSARLRAIMEKQGYVEIRLTRDFAGQDRVISGKKG